ncbi:hypothetical protein K469DRAFT_210631 [Zopfia rhizophila CBS 207.26]|uniref:Uncharacterized protein n=1 Tax=Zopfia rhizophila CBS 207.26 TaxID=1314779 RepID=A0A6A6DZG2_9PEZI|nr:hypothetical protein K469DRAFT_210631 [Zopfia rhizophila CBS 207.26]
MNLRSSCLRLAWLVMSRPACVSLGRRKQLETRCMISILRTVTILNIVLPSSISTPNNHLSFLPPLL